MATKTPSAKGTSPSVRTLTTSPSAQAPEMCVIAFAGPCATQTRPHDTLKTAMAQPEANAPATVGTVAPRLEATKTATLPAKPSAAAVAVSFTLHTDEPPLRARAAHAANTATLAASMTMNVVWASSSAGPRLPSEGASAKYRESPNMARSIHDQKKLAPTMASHEEEPFKALKFIAPFLETRYAVGAIIARPPPDN